MHPKIRRIEIEYKEDLSLEFIEGLIETAMPTTIFGSMETRSGSIILKAEISIIDLLFLLVDNQNAELLGYVWLKKQVKGFWELHKSIFFIEDTFTDIEKNIISKIIQEKYDIHVSDINSQNKINTIDHIKVKKENIYYFPDDFFSTFYVILDNKTSYIGLEYFYDNTKKIWPYKIHPPLY